MDEDFDVEEVRIVRADRVLGHFAGMWICECEQCLQAPGLFWRVGDEHMSLCADCGRQLLEERVAAAEAALSDPPKIDAPWGVVNAPDSFFHGARRLFGPEDYTSTARALLASYLSPFSSGGHTAFTGVPVTVARDAVVACEQHQGRDASDGGNRRLLAAAQDVEAAGIDHVTLGGWFADADRADERLEFVAVYVNGVDDSTRDTIGALLAAHDLFVMLAAHDLLVMLELTPEGTLISATLDEDED